MRLSIYGLALALTVCGAAEQAVARQQQPAPAAATPTAAAPKKAEEKLPTVEEVFDRYSKALGGKEAFDRLKSRVSKGKVELAPMSASGTVEVSQKAPDRLLTVMNLSGLGEFKQAYDGGTGWAKDPFNGLRELKGAELAAARRGATLDQAARNALYAKLAVTGRGKVGEREVYVVEATPAEGEPDRMYFDTQSWLLLRTDTVVDGPQGRVQSESYIEDYRKVDGVLVPHTIRQVIGPSTITTRIEEVKHDVALDEAIFKKPSA